MLLAGWVITAGFVAEGVQGEAHLLEVVLALHAGGGFADLLHGGQKQPDQDRDDGDDDEQFDQCETGSVSVSVVHDSHLDLEEGKSEDSTRLIVLLR